MTHEWTAVRLGLLSADVKSRVFPGRRLVDHLVRLALVVDLALIGRIDTSGQTISIDNEPTGLPAADAVLAHLDARPERGLLGPVGGADLDVLDLFPAAPRGRTLISGTYVVVDSDQIVDAWHEVHRTARRGIADDPRSAVVALFAGAAGMVDISTDRKLLAACAENELLVRDCLDYLDRLLLKLAAISAPSGGGGG